MEMVGGGLCLTPVSQTVATKLNGKQVGETQRISNGDRITFGNSALEIMRVGRDPQHEQSLGTMVIGRDDSLADVVVKHPTVSRRHAVVNKSNDGWRIRDSSTNGTFVNGLRIDGSQPLKNGDEVRIGPIRLQFASGTLSFIKEARRSVAIAAQEITVDVRTKSSGQLRILHPATLEVGAGEFVCIVGGSGAGKSTLMNALAGRSQLSGGEMMIDGVNLAEAFAALKQFIAFVPQKEALHDLLTVRQALGYVAELRLPTDMHSEERSALIANAISDVELDEHMDKPFNKLSGGQRKRACLAAEILCQPRILFLDEVTSGLDEQSDYEIMGLLARLAKRGTTIVCVTHTLANIMRFCTSVAVMGKGGHLAFYGPPAEALSFFEIDRLGEAFERLGDGNAAEWSRKYRDLSKHGKVGSGSQAASNNLDQKVSRLAYIARVTAQFGVLLRRNFSLVLADANTMLIVLVQALVIGVFVGWALSDYGGGLEATNARQTLLTLLVMSSMWIGCNGASKDIVSEKIILQRERDVNLSLLAYLLSKVIVSSAFVTVQIALMFGLVMILSDGIPGDLFSQFALVCFTGYIGVAIGLLISAATDSATQSTAIVPLTLIPQLIFVGTIVTTMPEFLDHVTSITMPTNVMNEAMLSIFIIDMGSVEEYVVETGKIQNIETRPIQELMQLAFVHYIAIFITAYSALKLKYRDQTK